MASTFLSLHYHVVFSTKDRRPLLRAEWRAELHDYLGGTVNGLEGISEIVGGIKAETARLSGTVRGTIDVRELVVLKTARIHGDVHYDALTIEQGAQVEGRFAPRTNVAATAPDDEPRLTLAR